MSIESALILDAARIPSAADVAAAIAAHGHRVEFPKGFEFAHRDGGLWRTAMLDGESTGFDYLLYDAAEAGDPETVVPPAGAGDRLLSFGARGDASIKLVAHVERAICELTGAQGWIEEELVPTDEMIAGATHTIENWDRIAAGIRAVQTDDGKPRRRVRMPLAPAVAQPGMTSKRENLIWLAVFVAAAVIGLGAALLKHNWPW